jgi:hypothetical protein
MPGVGYFFSPSSLIINNIISLRFSSASTSGCIRNRGVMYESDQWIPDRNKVVKSDNIYTAASNFIDVVEPESILLDKTRTLILTTKLFFVSGLLVNGVLPEKWNIVYDEIVIGGHKMAAAGRSAIGSLVIKNFPPLSFLSFIHMRKNVIHVQSCNDPPILMTI